MKSIDLIDQFKKQNLKFNSDSIKQNRVDKNMY